MIICVYMCVFIFFRFLIFYREMGQLKNVSVSIFVGLIQLHKFE